MSISDIHLCSRSTMLTLSTSPTTELSVKEEEGPLNNLIQSTIPRDPKLVLDKKIAQEPPFPQRLEIAKHKEDKKGTTFAIMDQLGHTCVQIPLF